MTILKCSECGNTFKIDRVLDRQIVACPICEASFEIQIKDGRIKLAAFVYENEDLGEL